MICPVCRMTLKRGTTNIELNQHVDRCLGQQPVSSPEIIPQIISDDEIEIIESSDMKHAKPVPPKKRNKPPDKPTKSGKSNKLQNAFSLMMPRK